MPIIPGEPVFRQARAGPLIAKFQGAGNPPKCPPDPAYPTGIDINMVKPGETKTCAVTLVYPSPCVGQWLIQCKKCDLGAVVVTAAGRVDDPRKVTVACRRELTEEEQRRA